MEGSQERCSLARPLRSLHTYSRCDCRGAKVIAAATCMSFVRRRRFLLRRLQGRSAEVEAR